MLSARIAAHVARLLLAAVFLTIPAGGFAQVPGRTVKGATRSSLLTLAQPRKSSLTVAPIARTAPTATTTESEPNDVVAQADLVTLGDTAAGTISVTDDVDTYALDLVAGTKVDLDVIAQRAGSPLDPTLTLIGPDGVSVLAFSDDFVGSDSHIEFFITVTGRYFVQIQAFAGVGSPSSTYSLSFGSVPAGPGDPPTLYAAGLGVPSGMAAGAAGELYVTDINALRLSRIAPTGQVTEVATFPGEVPVGVVVDGLGDVLVSTVNRDFTGGRILRFSGGQRSTFAADLQAGAEITVGPDGDVWVIDPIARVLRHYDALGEPKGTISLSSLAHFAFDMGLAFSPAGDLYLSNGFDSIYKIVGGAPQLVFQTSPFLNGLAFDADGFLYVANGSLGRVILLDPELHVVEDPFASSYQSGSTQLAFLRDASGSMTSRLLADNTGLSPTALVGGIIEMNPAKMRGAGFRVAVDLLHVANATLNDGVVGADYADALQLVESSATGRVSWSVSTGALPPGLTLSVAGQLTGIPTKAGAFAFALRADAGGQFALKSFTVTVTNPTVSAEAAAQHLLGGARLDVALLRFLDLQGNRNGDFDVGDLRAFLRANGQLPTTVAGKGTP